MTELRGLHLIEVTYLEVKGQRDGAWRDAGTVVNTFPDRGIMLNPSHRTLTEDTDRLASL